MEDGTAIEEKRRITLLSMRACRLSGDWPNTSRLQVTNVLRAAEFFLRHRLFRSCKTDEPRQPETFHGKVRRSIHSVTDLHYPLYWHYDILQALTILHRAGKLGDPRTSDAIDLVRSKRGEDGRWSPEGYYWNLKRKTRPKLAVTSVDTVNWGRSGPNEFITLNALRVLKTAGRFGVN